MSTTQTRSHLTQIGRVIIPVSDQSRALEFFSGTLGFEKGLDVPYGYGDRWLEVSPPGAPTGLALIPPREGDPIGLNTGVSFTTTDADASHAHLQAHGVDVDPEVMRMGDPVPPMFLFRDPDGNTFMVVETD